MSKETQERVVIVGGGFGGLYAALALDDAPHLEITLIDRRNYHLFQPLLYQVATAGLSPRDIAQPIRHIVAGMERMSVLMAEVTRVDLAAKRVETDRGPVEYDRLILAAGAAPSYFGHDEWEKVAPGLKGLDQALEIRRRVLMAFERAETELDAVKRKQLLTFVVIGGGPTGVEMAGALVELARHTLRDEFRHVDPAEAHVVLLESGKDLLGGFDPELRRVATQRLKKMGVEVRTGHEVTKIAPDGVDAGGHHIAAQTVLWAAGVQGPPIAKDLEVPLDKNGRVIVEIDLSLPGHPEVQVIGDMAVFLHQGDKPLPGLAPVAIQMGKHAAENIRRAIRGERALPFKYSDRGMLATIGRNTAVAQIAGWHFSGFTAWLVWVVVHIFFLIGFRNRVIVMFEWMWAYTTYNRGVRLITKE